MLEFLANGFAVALTPHNLLYCFIGCLWGTVVGVLPGLGPLAGLTLLLPLTFKLDPTSALIMLAGIFYGAMYGGSTTSILLRIPGEAASVMTCIDGHEMAKRGHAARALSIAFLSSMVGGLLGAIGLTLSIPLAREPSVPMRFSIERTLSLNVLARVESESARASHAGFAGTLPHSLSTCAESAFGLMPSIFAWNC